MCASLNGDAIYIDLGDPAWRAVQITPSGWSIIHEVPVRFIRSASTKALPVPETGGSIRLFRPFCNLRRPPRKDQEGTAVNTDFVVLIGHILAIFRPDSYPVFVALGEHGSCKSTLAILIVRLTDPRAPEQRSPPTNEEDLLVAAKTAHVLPYDNFSHLPDWLSDAFCRLATGGGAGKRKLYTDDDEILFEGRRPILLTGIEDFVTRPDLVDRANFFNHETVKDKDRLSDQEIETRFQRDKAKIFGVLLDGVITIEKRTKPEDKPETSSASSEPSAPSAEAGNINDLGGESADDTLTIADDPKPSADDSADDQQRGIVSGNPLKNRPSDDADGADDELVLYSEKVGTETSDSMLTYAKTDSDLDGFLDRRHEAGKRCAQCRGRPDGKEQQYQQRGRIVWLHRECRPYWLKEHPQWVKERSSDPTR